MTDHPIFAPMNAGTVSTHGTAIALGGPALLVCGPSGSGKSGLAAQMIGRGAALVADDLCLIRQAGKGLEVFAPAAGPAAIELRGIGLIPVSRQTSAPLVAIVMLGASIARLPEPEHIQILGRDCRVLRHPYQFDTADKLALWLGALS